MGDVFRLYAEPKFSGDSERNYKRRMTVPTTNDQPTACEEYPGKHCSASECLAASKFLRELIAELDIEEAKKPAWWRMIWGISEARRHYAIAAQHAEDLARERKPNPSGLRTAHPEA